MEEKKVHAKVGRPAGRRPRYVIRVHKELYALLETEAAETGCRVGTIASDIIAKESETLRTTGIYELPERIDTYELTHTHEVQAGPQMSIYVTEDIKKLIDQLQDRTGDRTTIILTGMLLAHLEREGRL